jgi:hypothetical protein
MQQSASPITVTADADLVVVAVLGPLQRDTASMLLNVVQTALEVRAEGQRVEIDIRDLGECSASGLAALTTCASLGARVREGLAFRVGSTGRG